MKLMKKVDSINYLIYNHIVIEVETSVSHLLTDGLQVCTLFFVCKATDVLSVAFLFIMGVCDNKRSSNQ